MHDPMVVAFTIRRPWPTRSTCGNRSNRWSCRGVFWRVAGHTLYWPSLITVWHVEPGGRDSGEVCPHYRRTQRPDGTWDTKILHGWRWHINHWRIQIGPLQTLRRRLFDRCEWCGGRDRKSDPCNVSHQWDGGGRDHWWTSTRGLFHHDCSMVEHAHRSCACLEPAGDRWKSCEVCGLHQGGGTSAGRREQRRMLHTVPRGSRAPADLLAAHKTLGARLAAEEQA